jgi:hypothetical protein
MDGMVDAGFEVVLLGHWCGVWSSMLTVITLQYDQVCELVDRLKLNAIALGTFAEKSSNWRKVGWMFAARGSGLYSILLVWTITENLSFTSIGCNRRLIRASSSNEQRWVLVEIRSSRNSCNLGGAD